MRFPLKTSATYMRSLSVHETLPKLEATHTTCDTNPRPSKHQTPRQTANRMRLIGHVTLGGCRSLQELRWRVQVHAEPRVTPAHVLCIRHGPNLLQVFNTATTNPSCGVQALPGGGCSVLSLEISAVTSA